MKFTFSICIIIIRLDDKDSFISAIKIEGGGKMLIGEKILEFRQKAKMTQKEMAMKLNISDKVISRWETGKSIPDVEMMLKISKLFNISIAQLYDYIDEVDINNEEKVNNDRIWEFIKYNIISYCFLLLVPLLILFSFYQSSYEEVDSFMYYVCIIIFFMAIILFVVSIIFEIIQFVKLKSFSDNKFYNKQYKNVLKKYGCLFICFFIFSLLATVIVFLSFFL
jgi:transcriptional regulator with XRE-family HTH domain